MHRRSEDIQVLRGIAILLVLAVHWSLGTLVFQRLGLNNPGWIGVELFFVVSGFVVVRSFERSAFDLGRFANARAFRLFPALALMLALALVANPVLPGVTPAEALGHLWTDQRTLLGQSLAVLLGFHPSAAFGQSYQPVDEIGLG